jgi:hypothetical protein
LSPIRRARLGGSPKTGHERQELNSLRGTELAFYSGGLKGRDNLAWGNAPGPSPMG